MTVTSTFTDLYTEILQFYATQVHLLDDEKVVEFAATFTDDAEFQHTPTDPPARTREGIITAVQSFLTRFENDPVIRRHWFNQVSVTPQEDGTIHTTFYALVVTTRPGQTPIIAPSCVARDVLVRENGRLLTRSRHVEHDEIR